MTLLPCLPACLCSAWVNGSRKEHRYTTCHTPVYVTSTAVLADVQPVPCICYILCYWPVALPCLSSCLGCLPACLPACLDRRRNTGTPPATLQFTSPAPLCWRMYSRSHVYYILCYWPAALLCLSSCLGCLPACLPACLDRRRNTGTPPATPL